MEQPKSTEKNGDENMMCKLLKPLYGLKQSGREWYKELDKYVTAQGIHRTEADPCVYVQLRRLEILRYTLAEKPTSSS